MAQIIGGKVLDNSLQDLFKSIDQLQESKRINETKRVNDLNATEDYLSKLAEGNNLGITGVLRENPDIAKRYLSLSGVGKKEIDTVYQQILDQTLSTDLRVKDIQAKQGGDGDTFYVEGEESSVQASTPSPSPLPPDPTLSLNPQEANFQGQVQNFPEYNMDQAVPNKTKNNVGFKPNSGIAGFGGDVTKTYGKSYVAVDNRPATTLTSIGEVKGGRFIPSKDSINADANEVVGRLLISSGYRAEAIEQKDIDDYKSFLVNSNNAKDFDELLRKGFKIPPRVLGKNEIEIIAKLTPALQKQYASLIDAHEKAVKAGNVNGAAKVQERMNTMTSGYTVKSPYVLSERDYVELGARLGTQSKRETVETLMALAQLDSKQLDAGLKKSQIDANESQIIRNQVAMERDRYEMASIEQQMKNNGMSDAQILDYNLKMMGLKKAERDYQNEPAESLRKTEEAFVNNYKKLADTKGVTDEQKKKFIQSQIEGNTGVMGKYKQDYLRNAQYNNWGVIPTADMTEDDYSQAQFVAQKELTENLDVVLYNHFTGLLGVSREANSKHPMREYWAEKFKKKEEPSSQVKMTNRLDSVVPEKQKDVKEELKSKYQQKKY